MPLLRPSPVLSTPVKGTKTVKVNKTTPNLPKYIPFVEKVNGRCAMQGFIWGSVKAAVTGQTIMEQIMTQTVDYMPMAPDSVLELVAISTLVTAGSVITDTVDPDQYELSEKFTMNAEMVNGRLAMLGFVILSGLHFSNI